MNTPKIAKRLTLTIREAITNNPTHSRGQSGSAARKRHSLVDTLGLVWAVVVHAASVQDQDGAKLVLNKMTAGFRRWKVVFAESAHARSGLPQWVMVTVGWILQPVLKPVKVKGFVVLPKRGIVERSFAWLGRYRRLSKDYECNPATSETMLQIAMTNLMLKRPANPPKK